MRYIFTTLRFRLILLVFLAVLPALGVILYSGLEQRRLAAEAAQKDVLDMVHHASLYQERVVEGVRQMLFTLAELPAVRQQDGAVASAIFARILAKQKIYGNISAVDRQGKVFASARPQPGPAASDVGRSHFERALQTRDFAIGEFGIGRTSGKPTLHFAYPVLDHGVVQGVVSVSVILDYLNILAARTPMPAGSMLTIIDRDGTILARYPQEQWVGKRLPEVEIIRIVLARGEGTAKAVGIDGVHCLFAFTPLEAGSRDLLVYAGVPLKTVYAEAHRTLYRNFLALGGAGLLALVAAWMLGQFFLIGRTRTLVNQAQQFAGGDLRVRSGLSYDDGEFGQLARSFDEMAATLQQRQESLRESEEKYRALVEQLPAVTFTISLDEARGLLYISPQIEALLGISPREFLADADLWKRRVHPDDLEKVAAELSRIAATGEPGIEEFRMQAASGATLWFRAEAMLMRNPEGRGLFIQGVMLDITERKRAEEDLVTSEVRYRTLVENIDLGITLISSDYKIIMANAGMGKLFEKQPEELAGKYCFREFEKRDGICAHCPGTKAMASGQPAEVDTVGTRDDGTLFYAHVRTFPTFDFQGNVTGFIELVEDMTARRQAEDALRQSEARFRDIADNVAEWVWEVNLEGKFTYSSPVVEQLLGYWPEEVLGQHFFDFFPPDERQELKEKALAMFVTPKPFRDFISQNLHKNGNTVWLSTSGVPVLDATGNLLGYRGANIDITERRKSQEALEIANAQLKTLLEEADERNRDMALLNDMVDVLQSCRTSAEAFDAISHYVPKFFPIDAGALYLLRNSKNLLSSVTVWGQPPPSEEWFPPDDCWAVRGGRVHRVDDPASALICKHVPLTGTLATGYLCVPLMAQGTSLGIFHIRFLSCAAQGREAGALEAKQRLAVAIAENLSLALANLKLRESLQNQAIHDPLTGLYNRRYLEETMDRELHRARRQQTPLGVVMMDLDHFKDFNDTFGHAGGDALLSAVANLMKANMRKEDIACRYGGEEFLLIMPGASLPAVQERADNLRQAVKTLQVKYQGRFLKSTTISLGVAIFPDQGHTAEEVISAADAALYRAKQAGRDRVEIAALNSPAAAVS